MDRILKQSLIRAKKADAAADIGLINEYSLTPLTPEGVFCFSVILCDNDVDRDHERFTNACLDELAPRFVGKTGLFDHNWSAEKQNARLYRVEALDLDEMNSLGETRRVLRGDAYMLRNDKSAPIIAAIEGGILREVSIGCQVSACTCSICGEPFSWCGCKNGHTKGGEYDGKPCYGELSGPMDAYEFSFVAVPAQRGAGITKTAGDPASAAALLLEADWSTMDQETVKTLIRKGQEALATQADRQKRAALIAKYSKI